MSGRTNHLLRLQPENIPETLQTIEQMTIKVLAPSLRKLSARDILLRYRGLVANVPYKDVLRCLLTVLVSPTLSFHDYTHAR